MGSNKATWFFWGFFFAAIAGLAIYLGPGGRDLSHEGLYSVSPSGLKAYTRLLQHYGKSVDETRIIPSGKDAASTALFVRSSVLLPNEQMMIDYLQDGGRIITSQSIFREGPDPYVSSLQNDPRYLRFSSDSDRTYRAKCSSFYTYQVETIAMTGEFLNAPQGEITDDGTFVESAGCFPFEPESYETQADRVEFVDEKTRQEAPGVYLYNPHEATLYGMVVTKVGKGEVIMLTSYDFLYNQNIVDHDAAVLAYRLFEGKDSILVLEEGVSLEEDGSLEDSPIPAGASYADALMYIALIIFTAANLLRPGRVVPEPLLNRRQAHETTLVIGDMLRTARHYKMATSVLQKTVCNEVARRTGIPIENQAEIIETVHAQTNFDRDQIQTLLFRDTVESNEEFVLFAKSITQLRKRLKTVAQGRYSS